MKIDTYPDTTDSLSSNHRQNALDLVDGGFAVVRSNGQVDREWTLYTDETKLTPKSGEPVPAVMLFRETSITHRLDS